MTQLTFMPGGFLSQALCTGWFPPLELASPCPSHDWLLPNLNVFGEASPDPTIAAQPPSPLPAVCSTALTFLPSVALSAVDHYHMHSFPCSCLADL